MIGNYGDWMEVKPWVRKVFLVHTAILVEKPSAARVMGI